MLSSFERGRKHDFARCKVTRSYAACGIPLFLQILTFAQLDRYLAASAKSQEGQKHSYYFLCSHSRGRNLAEAAVKFVNFCDACDSRHLQSDVLARNITRKFSLYFFRLFILLAAHLFTAFKKSRVYTFSAEMRREHKDRDI